MISGKKLWLSIWLCLLGLATACGFLCYYGARDFLSSVPDRNKQPVIFVVSAGQNLKTISRALEKNHLVTNADWFRLYARYKGVARQIKAGEYQMSTGLRPAEILDLLVQGKERLISLSFPEGFTMDQVAQRAEKKGFCRAQDFSALCRDHDFVKTLGVPSHSLEGFLFPDTYFFPVHADCKTIIEKMVTTFFQKLPTGWGEKAHAMGFSLQEVITLASMIEKETGDAAERPLISSVFHNRLKKRMRLESDPTVLYGIRGPGDRIRKKDLQRMTPYNTYRIKGLPKGPIANPGFFSIQAALSPLDTPYLYFVSKNNRTHHFSKTLKEHNKAVYRYQIQGKIGD